MDARVSGSLVRMNSAGLAKSEVYLGTGTDHATCISSVACRTEGLIAAPEASCVGEDGV